MTLTSRLGASPDERQPDSAEYFAHPTALVESRAIGARTRIWAFAHILPGAQVGSDCNICDGVFIENDVIVGNRVTIKSGVQLWDSLTLEDEVFVGPNATFTNDPFPKSRQHLDRYPRTVVRKGASVGANATILPGLEIGECSLIGAGAVVTKDVPQDAIVVGNPARVIGTVRDRVPTPPRGPYLVDLPTVPDARGLLTFGQYDDHVPFVPRRYYTLSNVPPLKVRGEHAHRGQHGFYVCLVGGLTMSVDDGHDRLSWRLDTPAKGLYIPPLHWVKLTEFTSDAVLFCLASTVFNEADYIRDYAEFTRITSRA